MKRARRRLGDALQGLPRERRKTQKGDQMGKYKREKNNKSSKQEGLQSGPEAKMGVKAIGSPPYLNRRGRIECAIFPIVEE